MCFCEDCDHNDGIEKPYFMSTGLMVSENFHNFKLSYYRNLKSQSSLKNYSHTAFSVVGIR